MKKYAVRALSIVLVLAMLLSMLAASAFAFSLNLTELAQNEDDNLGRTYEVQDIISLVDAESHTIRIPIADMTPDELRQLDLGSISLCLDRDPERPYLDEILYPNQISGGDMTDTSIWRTEHDLALFSDFSLTAEEEDGTAILQVCFNSNYFYYDASDATVPHIIGGAYLNWCGWFRLNARLGERDLGGADVKLVPYDSYHTMEEIYAGIDDIVELAAGNGLYAVRESMGSSSAGRDIPYIIISDSRSSVDSWLAFTEEAENHPTQTLADLEAGVYDDIRVPVLYSNIHASEVAAVDGILMFAEQLAQAGLDGTLSYNMLTGFTEAGQAQLAKEMNDPERCKYIAENPSTTPYGVAVPALAEEYATYLGFLQTDNKRSGQVDLDAYYEQEERTVSVRELLGGVFFILVPEENVDGRVYNTRTASNGYDLNRDNAFQTTPETANMQHLIGTYNPVIFTEYHGLVKNFQCEPCTPPHEPNFEYDLLAEHLISGGEAFGIGAVANNASYNSYVMPQRDFLLYTDKGRTKARWAEVWDDMSTGYSPQFAMLHGCVGYTVELPAYNDAAAAATCYGTLSQADYVREEKLDFLTAQVKIFERGVNNYNSDAYELVGQWYCDQNDTPGAEMDQMRPEFSGEEENGNFYPECYLIPLDGEHQSNVPAARDMMIWLSRNDVKVSLTTEPIEYGGTTYPAGTLVVPMYQAKRSVANSALYDGTLLQSWSSIYSENITTFNETRGFQMETVTKTAEYQRILAVAGACMDYEAVQAYAATLTSSFYGEAGMDVIIRNDSTDAVAAVNTLLQEGKKVGMILSGEQKGDFICSYEDYLTVADRYILLATGIAARSEGIEARCIGTSPTVYLACKPNPYYFGCIVALQVGYPNWNYDRVAMEEMNFRMTEDLNAADAIVGSDFVYNYPGDEGDKEIDAILAGKPYIGYGNIINSYNGLDSVFSAMGGVTRTKLSGARDCLAYVTYPNSTLVNASYIAGGDDTLYGYSYENPHPGVPNKEAVCLGYFSKIPGGAVPLVAVDSTRKPMQGFIPSTGNDRAFYNGGVLGFSYDDGTLHIALFANSLTEKAHQKDEYNYISNFLFSSLLTEEAYVGYCAHIPEGEVIAPTCTRGGCTLYTCTVCGVQYFADETAPLGHSYENGVCIRCGAPEPVHARLLLGTATGRAGDTVTLSLTIEHNPGILPFRPIPVYDTEKLELLGIEQTELMQNAAAGGTDGVIANLIFRIKEDCAPAALSVSLQNMPVIENPDTAAEFDIAEGRISVVDYLPGDLDSDGSITVRDLLLLRRYLVDGAPFPADVHAADVDGNPGIDELDVAYLHRYLAYWDGYQLSYPEI